MESIMRAAGALLGADLLEPVDLAGSTRSTVLRCRVATGGSVIVKAFADEPEARRAFATEAAGLSLGAGGPELLGVDVGARLLVMADLGAAPTLADTLLGADPEAAAHGLLAWARGLGRLAADSIHQRADLDRQLAHFGPGVMPSQDDPWCERNATELLALLPTVGVTAPDGLAAELARIGTAGGEDFPTFTPGDTCPDNNLLTPDGLRLIDFEEACFWSVFLTAAYCRMPFSTCWCTFSLPADLAHQVEQTYRAEVVPLYPALAQDEVWQAGMQQAMAVWTVDVTIRHLPRALAEDAPMHPTRRPVPTRRELLTHRWTMAATLTELPAFARTMRLLLDAVATGWRADPLPLYPAFAGSAAPPEVTG